MGSFGIGEWVIALLIVAVILGTRKLFSSLATRAKPDPLDAPAGAPDLVGRDQVRRQAAIASGYGLDRNGLL